MRRDWLHKYVCDLTDTLYRNLNVVLLSVYAYRHLKTQSELVYGIVCAQLLDLFDADWLSGWGSLR